MQRLQTKHLKEQEKKVISSVPQKGLYLETDDMIPFIPHSRLNECYFIKEQTKNAELSHPNIRLSWKR